MTLRLMSVSVKSMSATPPPCARAKIHTVLSTPQNGLPRASLRMSWNEHTQGVHTPQHTLLICCPVWTKH